MSKKLPITVNGADYVLQYNRWAIKQIEAKGFSVDKISDKLVTSIELMFQGALIMNHPRVKASEANKLFDAMSDDYDTSELIELLVDLYTDALPVLSGEGEGKKKLEIVEN